MINSKEWQKNFNLQLPAFIHIQSNIKLTNIKFIHPQNYSVIIKLWCLFILQKILRRLMPSSFHNFLCINIGIYCLAYIYQSVYFICNSLFLSTSTSSTIFFFILFKVFFSTIVFMNQTLSFFLILYFDVRYNSFKGPSSKAKKELEMFKHCY